MERIPNPRVARAPLVWSVLAAYGAGFFVSAAILIVFTLFARFFGLPTVWVAGLATVGATATVLSVAYTSGSRDAVLICAGILTFGHVLALLGTMRFCLAIVSEASFCSPFSYVLGFWPEATGVALAYRLLRWWRVAEGSGNPLLEATGALALAQIVVASILGALLVTASPFESGLLVLLAAAAGGVGCGLAIVRRVDESRQWGTVLIIALVVAAIWLIAGVPSFLGQIGVGGGIAIGGLGLIGVASPVVEVGAAALVLYMATARRVTATGGV
ncbi:MAG: hypothetical protein M3T56_16570 [Chloroflexota bacterium]|nr:hypothetical protein [Chloroflexota bacterium]